MNVPTVQQGRTFLPISKVFEQAPVEDLGEGIRAALTSLSINQNVFSIRRSGGYEALPAAQSRQIEVVILRSAKTQSKTHWKGGKFKGDGEPPICWSSNSITPDVQVPAETKQNAVCATCPQNVFTTGEGGLKAKLCADHKRIALVPANDIENEVYGGAMIFRVPAGSLNSLDKYAKELKQYGVPYYAYTTIVSLILDPQKGVTKLQFNPGRPLSDEEAQMVKTMREGERAIMIVNDATAGLVEEEGEEAPVTPANPPPAAAPIAPRPQPVVAPRPQPAPTARPVVPPQGAINEAIARPATPPPSQREVVTTTSEEVQKVPSELDDLFGDLIKK